MRFSRTNMRLAAARCRSLSRKIGVQTAEFSITAFCWRNADSRKSRTYERHNAEIRLELFNLSLGQLAMDQFDHILNWKLQPGSHPFPGPDGGTCINEAAVVAAGFPYQPVRCIEEMPACFSRPICRWAL